MTLSRRPPFARLLLVLVAVGALAAVGGVAYLFLRGAPPPPVGLASASPGASTSGGSAAPLPTGAGTLGAGDLDGSWVIDTSIGSFADFSSSFVGYRVNETFTNQKANTAVGRTPNVEGSLTLDGSSVTAVDVTADLTTLESDDDRRDGQLQRQAIETQQFPTATFKLTSPVDLGSVPADGQAVQATASGELALHGVTRSVVVPIQARLSGDVVTVTGAIEIAFADYEIEQPSSFIVLSIEDHGTMEFQLHFRHS